ncbi:MAG: aminotransferase class V-fold PLP-dependent enzyme [Caldisericales bacterium]|nr:aminotransferase class V-fold PLP-dependent enzyme [Caldisericales bacterium]
MPIYLDNASTSFPKPKEVTDHVVNYMKNVGGVPTAGYACKPQANAMEVVNECRSALSRLIAGSAPEQIYLCKSASEAISTIMRGMLEVGDKIAISDGDPWPIQAPARELEQRGTSVARLPFDNELFINPRHLAKVAQKVRAVFVSHVSNITGTIAPMDEISNVCHETDSMLVLDASHTIGVCPIDLKHIKADAIIFSGHKGLYGPTGTAGVYVSQRLSERLTKLSKTGLSAHQILEIGTPNMAGLYGLLAGARFVGMEGIDRIRQHNRSLRENLVGSLEMVKKIRVIAPETLDGIGIVSFSAGDLPVNTTARLLEERYGMIVGNGLFSNESAMRALNFFPQGALRASVGYFNTISDVECLATSLARIVGG